MIDNNIRTDYNKLCHLIRLDKRFGTNASIILEIVNNGETTAVIKDAFPVDPKVHATKGDTELRLVTLVFKGWEFAACEMALA